MLHLTNSYQDGMDTGTQDVRFLLSGGTDRIRVVEMQMRYNYNTKCASFLMNTLKVHSLLSLNINFNKIVAVLSYVF